MRAKLCCDKCRRQNGSRKGNKRCDPWNNFLFCLHQSGMKNKIIHRSLWLFPLRQLACVTLMASSTTKRSISIISSSYYADLLFVISRISNVWNSYSAEPLLRSREEVTPTRGPSLRIQRQRKHVGDLHSIYSSLFSRTNDLWKQGRLDKNKVAFI